MNNRLLVKPFVDGLIRECIEKELKGWGVEYQGMRSILEKTAGSFDNIFREKSLLIAVNYLTVWSEDQKREKITADSLYALGTRYRLGNDYEYAVEYFKPAMLQYKSIGDERGEAEILGSYGAINFNQSEFESALEYYRAALVKREKIDDKVLIGNTLSSIGSVYFEYYKDYDRALIYLDKAEAVRSETGETSALGRTIHVKAATLEEKGQLERALEYFRKSYELNIMSGAKLLAAQAALHSGQILNTIGMYPDALVELEKSITLYKEINSKPGEGNVLSQIGFVYSNLGDLNTAINKINEAAAIMKELNDMEGFAGVLNHLGIVLADAGRYEKALEYYFQSLGIFTSMEDKLLVLPVLSNIGNVYHYLKDYSKAEDYHARGLKICREHYAKNEEVHCLLNLANDQLLLGKLDSAKINYDLAGEIAKPFNNPDLDWRILVGSAEYYEQTREITKAIELNDSALTVLEELRNSLQTTEQKATYMASERYIYEDIINFLMLLHENNDKGGYDALAFSYAERSKSRVLLDLLLESKLSLDDSAKLVEHISSELLSLEKAKQICSDKNTVIFNYFTGDSSSCLWIVTKSSDRLFRIPARNKLQEQIEIIRFGLLDPKQDVSEFFTRAAVSLYDELIKPAESFLSEKSKLIIIPDGILNYLPFEVLLTDINSKTLEDSFSALPLLVKKYPVSYAQSASVLKYLLTEKTGNETDKSGSKKIIAFGDPVIKNESSISVINYPRLEYSGKEIENIASFFKKGNAEICLRDDATEENVKRESVLKKFNYVHFATHGFIDENKPDLSSLLLSVDKNSTEDGLLQMREIFNLKLNADLVVLSACQTGLGKLIRGEGIVGLTRAFMYAGTPSVLVSLWSVSDISTATLMGEFYKNLIKNKLSKTEALRKAQLTLMSDNKYAHPFYWAPFILIGDWR
ncbi:MAG: CHAT domain-containing tetratricopeptide repeat protein [Bacteroidota bacterium]